MDTFNQKQLNVVSTAIGVPQSEFTDSMDVKMAAMAADIETSKEQIKSLENRVRILEAENNGLRLALNN